VQGVCSLNHFDARVVAKFPVEYAVAGINRTYTPRSSLQQTIGEATDIAAEVGRNTVRRVYVKVIQGELKLQSTLPDERAILRPA
jgi:hypothetical protein